MSMRINLDKRRAHPQSLPVTRGTFSASHTYRMEWFPDHVGCVVGDTIFLGTEKDYVPTQPQQLHMNLWGVPTK